jgi:predicted acyl esterase
MSTPAGELGIVFERDVPATMRDGVVLRADVARPDAPGFPNHDRNHNTGRNDLEDPEIVSAEQRVFHDAARPSRIVLPLM